MRAVTRWDSKRRGVCWGETLYDSHRASNVRRVVFFGGRISWHRASSIFLQHASICFARLVVLETISPQGFSARDFLDITSPTLIKLPVRDQDVLAPEPVPVRNGTGADVHGLGLPGLRSVNGNESPGAARCGSAPQSTSGGCRSGPGTPAGPPAVERRIKHNRSTHAGPGRCAIRGPTAAWAATAAVFPDMERYGSTGTKTLNVPPLSRPVSIEGTCHGGHK